MKSAPSFYQLASYCTRCAIYKPRSQSGAIGRYRTPISPSFMRNLTPIRSKSIGARKARANGKRRARGCVQNRALYFVFCFLVCLAILSKTATSWKPALAPTPRLNRRGFFVPINRQINRIFAANIFWRFSVTRLTPH